MTFEEFKAGVVAEAEKVKAAIADWLNAHPEVESETATAATNAVNSLSSAAAAEVTKIALPPEAVSAIDTAIAAAQADADNEIAAVQAKLADKVASLQAAKGAPQ